MDNAKVVVTGIGAVTPFGDYRELWQNLLQGNSALVPITEFDVGHCRSKTAGIIENFKPQEITRDTKIVRIPRCSQFAWCSAHLALGDAGFKVSKETSMDVGVFFATLDGPGSSTQKIYDELIERGPSAVDPALFTETVFNAPASVITIKFGIRGPAMTLPMGTGGGGYSIAQAMHYLRKGTIKWALVVASDEYTEITHTSYSKLHLLSPNDGFEEGSRPFDRHRNGLIRGEGGACLFLETAESAQSRGAKIYGSLEGYGMSSDAYKIAGNDPSGKGVSLAMKKALDDAKTDCNQIDWIVAFANSQKNWDLMETNAIKQVFKKNAYGVPVTSIKGALGEVGGPAPIFNVIAGLMGIEHGKLAPTINYQTPDPECDLDYVPNKMREKEINKVLVNAYSWGGIYSSIIIGRWE